MASKNRGSGYEYEPEFDLRTKVLLAFKGLQFENGKPWSPSYRSTWNSEGYIFAECPTCAIPLVSDPDCSCGIYATVSKVIVRNYLRNTSYYLSPVVLVAACGETDVWASGWKAQAAQAHYVVDFPWEVGRRTNGVLATKCAQEFFGLEIIRYQDAIGLIVASWEDCGYERLGVSKAKANSNIVYSDPHVHLGFRKKRESARWQLDELVGIGSPEKHT